MIESSFVERLLQSDSDTYILSLLFLLPGKTPFRVHKCDLARMQDLENHPSFASAFDARAQRFMTMNLLRGSFVGW